VRLNSAFNELVNIGISLQINSQDEKGA
jgi:hypothetical protein